MSTIVEFEKRQERRNLLRNLLGLSILLAALGWATVHVAIHSFGPESDTALMEGRKVIRFAHWQLEGKCVQALNEAAREYERLHPGVAVRQIEIPERAYEQWVRTQLIGRTAPDLIEMRGWGDLIVRYFVPLADVVDKPNPYNDDDPNLAGLPWRETYVDNMLGGWNWELLDYYGMPLSLFTQRCFANKTLLKEAAGVTKPPKTLGEFIGICKRIEAYARKRREKEPDFRLVPIAGSKYTDNVFRGRYWYMATWDLLEEYDENCDGWFSEAERLEAVLTGKLDLTTDPRIRAGHQVLYDISRYFNPGFMAAQRDDSVFLFAQGNAVMIATGTWDAGSLWEEVGGDFEILVFDFPIPAPGEPYSKYIRHRITEAGDRAGFSLGLTRFSKHKAIAIDFMRFLTSRSQNEALNRKFRWFPAIRGAEPDPILLDFRPQSEGIYGVFTMDMPGDTRLRYDQKRAGYVSEVDPDEKAHARFLAAARGDRAAFLSQHGLLARRFLDKTKGKPAGAKEYPFDQYLRDWRDDHYQRFIDSYALDYKELALEDFRRTWVTSYYHRAVQAEGAIASSRARAMRESLSSRVRRNLASLILGQTNRLAERVSSQQVYDKLKNRTARPVEPAKEAGR